MIDKQLEPYYDIMFSIFCGIIFIMLIHNIYNLPRTIVVINDKEYFTKSCGNITM